MTTCWCTDTSLAPFSPDYGKCVLCGTLVSTNSLTDEQLIVENDETDFYGKQYWLGHQQQDLGFPDISARSRNDLTERNLHWISALLKYSLPPQKVMELGCAHGSFVALMQQAGYEASGVEMSPWVVAFGKKTFNVPIYIGPIESLNVPAASLDIIALMDVLEHLPDPAATMQHCLGLLKQEGVLLIQTPEFKEDIPYQVLAETKSPFLDQLKSDEHLYLFSRRSVTELFRQLGAEHIYFEPAIFSHYDMFLAVSRRPLLINSQEQIEAVLTSSPNGRFVLALLDLRQRELTLALQLQQSEADRAMRGEQIVALTALFNEADNDRVARNVQIETLSALLKESEADRAARGEQIVLLSTMLSESESDQSARDEQISHLSNLQVRHDTMAADLRILLDRPPFRWLAKLPKWPELKKLKDQLEPRDE